MELRRKKFYRGVAKINRHLDPRGGNNTKARYLRTSIREQDDNECILLNIERLQEKAKKNPSNKCGFFRRRDSRADGEYQKKISYHLSR